MQGRGVEPRAPGVSPSDGLSPVLPVRAGRGPVGPCSRSDLLTYRRCLPRLSILLEVMSSRSTHDKFRYFCVSSSKATPRTFDNAPAGEFA